MPNHFHVFLLPLICSVAACGAAPDDGVSAARQRVIFGDDRIDDDERVEYTNPIVGAGTRAKLDSIAAFTFLDNVFCSGSSCTLSLAAFSDPTYKNLCPAERFARQDKLRAPVCTSFLVGSDLMMTALHCLQDPSNPSRPLADICTSAKVVFDFNADANGLTPTSVPADSVYRCQSIVAKGPFPVVDGEDWVVLRTDRTVAQRIPFTLRRGGVIGDGQPSPILLQTAGYPLGLPQKFSSFGTLAADDQGSATEFQHDLDTLVGSSGGPVWERVTGVVVGIHGRTIGASQSVVQVTQPDGSRCYVPSVCPYEGCSAGTAWAGATRVGLAQLSVPLTPGSIGSVNFFL